MPKIAASYLAVFLTLFVVDMVWLRLIAVSWYQQGMGPLLSESPNLWAAAAFYLLYPVGLMIFAVLPGLSNQGGVSLLKFAATGAMFGFFAYATYDLTNLAVIKGWPLGLSILDMAWGSLVSGLAAVAGGLVINNMKS